ncbi:ribosomal-processing cysteine protease Prp [Bacillus sp. ISL-51]|uniref:ribosomal-processing cysteine protease Prp n=1 Tax=unclassified Bacillus (in: firmicutes) TaxID=185979 RepID=UPI001BEB6678|nr:MULTISPECIES: ribosomal-processing cysteine protease Prp [unclassified Bacillus (in: firmicutes)]MBT2574242.1 ribosomal-processing cysteine protease Prp [Bacillus sp. ISL-51]MBT2633061.1 ribosomal-processing cysteine protease Prp [Bacillus sp. ISL-26]
MIQATIRRSRTEEGVLSFEMTGHADFAEHGRDLVCAAVTAVVFGAVNAVIALAPLEPILDIGQDGGYFYFEFPEAADQEAFQKAQLLIEGMIVSLETIERDYNDHLRLTTNQI